jgi:hypothetical protein
MNTVARRGPLSSTVTAILLLTSAASPASAQGLTPHERQAIAEEAFIYGFAMVMNYDVFNEYFIDKSALNFKTPINHLYNTARVYTAIVTPNSDTPYSFIGIGKPFSLDKFSPEQKGELVAAMKRGIEKIKQRVATFGRDENGWRVATDGFGDRQAYAGDRTLRAAAAMAGIYGNDPAEALYPLLATDGEGNRPDTSKNRYTLTFPAGQLPSANAFGSVMKRGESDGRALQ